MKIVSVTQKINNRKNSAKNKVLICREDTGKRQLVSAESLQENGNNFQKVSWFLA
jgi:hypothetical protein